MCVWQTQTVGLSLHSLSTWVRLSVHMFKCSYVFNFRLYSACQISLYCCCTCSVDCFCRCACAVWCVGEISSGGSLSSRDPVPLSSHLVFQWKEGNTRVLGLLLWTGRPPWSMTCCWPEPKTAFGHTIRDGSLGEKNQTKLEYYNSTGLSSDEVRGIRSLHQWCTQLYARFKIL